MGNLIQWFAARSADKDYVHDVVCSTAASSRVQSRSARVRVLVVSNCVSFHKRQLAEPICSLGTLHSGYFGATCLDFNLTSAAKNKLACGYLQSWSFYCCNDQTCCTHASFRLLLTSLRRVLSLGGLYVRLQLGRLRSPTQFASASTPWSRRGTIWALRIT